MDQLAGNEDARLVHSLWLGVALFDIFEGKEDCIQADGTVRHALFFPGVSHCVWYILQKVIM